MSLVTLLARLAPRERFWSASAFAGLGVVRSVIAAALKQRPGINDKVRGRTEDGGERTVMYVVATSPGLRHVK